LIENFSKAMDFIFFWEGYYSNNPLDPGKVTIWGLSEVWHPGEVKEMIGMDPITAKEYAKTIYAKDYWNPLDGNNLPAFLDIVLMDIAVRQSVERAKHIQQYAGSWPDAIILSLDYLDDSKNFKTFGAGWAKRLVSLRNYIVSNFKILEWDPKELILWQLEGHL